MNNRILVNSAEDGIDRRGFLKCMAWAGTGMLWVMTGGVLRSYSLSKLAADPRSAARTATGELSFIQISDSHIGFSKEANPDVVGTLQAAIAKVNAAPTRPSFMLHTGDLSHLSKPSEFDTLDEVLKSAKPGKTFFVPGEHDILNDHGAQYRERYGKGTRGDGWYSFDVGGAHFIGLVNVMDLKPGGLGNLGADQLAWIEQDVRGLSSSTPIVVFAHIPLWSVYPEWGWGTEDAAQALSYLKRFGSVTVLNGHIHQTMQKVEGNITFHTAMSTAFPQPHPGEAPSPGPMTVPAEHLRQMLGLTAVNYIETSHSLAVVDEPLMMAADGMQEQMKGEHEDAERRTPAAGKNEVTIDNFTFQPKVLTVSSGTTVRWTNHDDAPHTVTSTDKKFASKALDTGDTFTHAFGEPGTYRYYCTIHPMMTGSVIVH